MKAKAKTVLYYTIIVVALVVWIAGFVVAWAVVDERKVEHVAVGSPIEDAVEISAFDYKFTEWRSGFLSAAGAGGQGAAVLWAKTPQQFVEELNPGETVYTTLKTTDHYVEKTYIAGVENRAMLLGYNVSYGHSGEWGDGDWNLVGFDGSEAVFIYDNTGGIVVFTIVWSILYPALGFMIIALLYEILMVDYY